jgi:hypothetical protein
VTVAPIRNPTFVTLSDGSIRNTYDVRLRNMQLHDATFRLSLAADAPLRMELEGQDDLTVAIPANEQLLQRVYVIAEPGSQAAEANRTEFRLWIEDSETSDRASRDTVFNGKGE